MIIYFLLFQRKKMAEKAEDEVESASGPRNAFASILKTCDRLSRLDKIKNLKERHPYRVTKMQVVENTNSQYGGGRQYLLSITDETTSKSCDVYLPQRYCPEKNLDVEAYNLLPDDEKMQMQYNGLGPRKSFVLDFF